MIDNHKSAASGLNSSRTLTTRCAYQNGNVCAGPDCKRVELCPSTNPDEQGSEKSDLCYVLWKISVDGEPDVKLKGCWVGAPSDCVERSRCVEHRRETKKDLLFCCCSGDMCNQEMYHLPRDSNHTTPAPSVEPLPIHPNYITLFTLGPIFMLIVLMLLFYWIFRYRKNHLPDMIIEDVICESQQPFIGFSPIRLMEVKASGRFGAVWKGVVNSSKDVDEAEQVAVAVKIFPPQDRASWQAEREIFALLQVRHDNILAFLGAEQKESLVPYNSEYWLITEYHEHGSLYDYLKSHLLTYKDLLKICRGVAGGLNYIHEEIPVQVVNFKKNTHLKPSIAHRDFKSKNVLLKADLTACVADFGLALVFYPNHPPNDTLGQVGTRRYMAPEVLEGAINFSRDALLRIDMYACALVMWECVSRCSAQDGPVQNYAVPFEEEVGLHPTLEDMQEAVCQQKKRPAIKEAWRANHGMNTLVDSIEECWDQDAEARLSASCVEERIFSLIKEPGNGIINYFAESFLGSPKNGYNCRLITETST